MKYIYMFVGTVVGGLLGCVLCLYVFIPYLIEDPNGFGGLIVSFYVICAGISIGAICFGRMGYLLGKRLHETDSDRTNPRLRRSKE